MPDWERDYIRVQDKIENINRQVRRHLSSSLCLSPVLKFWQTFKDRTQGTKADIMADENPVMNSANVPSSLILWHRLSMKLLPHCHLFRLRVLQKQV
jgi:hypothetical protein